MGATESTSLVTPTVVAAPPGQRNRNSASCTDPSAIVIRKVRHWPAHAWGVFR